MRGRPPRQNASELCDRVEVARRSLGLSRSALASRLRISPSTLSRSMARGACSKDVAARVNEFLEGTGGAMPDTPHIDSPVDVAALRRALHLLHELGKMAPDLESVLLRAVRGEEAEDAR